MKKIKTPRGDGNPVDKTIVIIAANNKMEKRKTPEGDGNSLRCSGTQTSTQVVRWTKEKPH